MREILFRGKRIDNGEWVDGSLLKVTINGKTAHLIFGDNFAFVGGDVKALSHALVDPSTVGQYTGLTANGKKVFEGDIIKAYVCDHELEDEYLSYTPIKVTFCGGYFYPFHLEGCWRSGVSDIEVIGNIHDNKSLLNNQEAGE